MRENLTYENFRRTAIGLIVLSSVPIVPTIIGFYVRNVVSVNLENPPADTLPEYWTIGALMVLVLMVTTLGIALILDFSRLIGEFVEAFIESLYG